MIPTYDSSALAAPLQLEGLFAEPIIFVAAWLLLGWLLFQANPQEPVHEDGIEVIDVQHDRRTDRQRLSGLQLVLLLVSIYVLFRYCRNR